MILKIIFYSLLLLLLLILVLVEAKLKDSGCFRAAVLDHVQQTDPSDPKDHGKNLELNLKVYEKAVNLAKKKGADIIVFPENGLIYSLLTRSQADHYAEDIPKSDQNLCSIDTKAVINRLSCMAKKNKIFIAANLIDRQPCEESKKCPHDKKYLFNTAVLFDRNGILIGKYHKMHLFGEMALNVPPKPELVVVHTELGRLGLQICFDMIFEKPGHLLAEQDKIDTMLFPTWWFDEQPFLSSSQYQMAWAFGNNVTLLASNIHRVELGSRGSGIYVGPKQKFVSAVYDDSIERLILANVPIKPKSKTDCPLDPEIVEVEQMIPVKNSVKYHHQNLNWIETNMVELPNNNDDYKIDVCHHGVCCSLEYKRYKQQKQQQSTCKLMDYLPLLSTIIKRYFSVDDERYFLLAGNRTRPGIYHWSEEFCALVNCASHGSVSDNETDPQTSSRGCSHYSPKNDLRTRFTYAKLTGKFSSEAYVYPSAIGSKQQLIEPNGKWSFWTIKTPTDDSTKMVTIEFDPKQTINKNKEKSSSESKDDVNILDTLALYGRVYQRDPVYERKAVKIDL